MLKNVLLKLIFSFIILFLVSCNIDWNKITNPNFPFWSTTLELQLQSFQVTLEKLAEDSLISVDGLNKFYDAGATQDSIFVYHKSIDIDKIEVGNKLEIEPVSTSFAQTIDEIKVSSISKSISSKVGTIKLANIDPIETEEPYTFSSIYPQLNNIPNGIQNLYILLDLIHF